MNNSDFDKILREKAINNFGKDYKKTSIDNVIYLANQKKKKIFMCRTIVCSACAFICLGLFLCIMLTYKENDLTNKNAVINKETNTNVEQAKTILYSIPDHYESTDRAPLYVALIKVKEVHDIGIVNFLPETIIEADVIQILEGELNQLSIEFKVNESIISVSKIPNEIKEDIKCEDDDKYIRLVLTEQMKKSTYPECGKYYIVSLTEEEEKLKVIDSCKYPIYEADIENKKVKIGDEWVKIEIYN